MFSCIRMMQTGAMKDGVLAASFFTGPFYRSFLQKCYGMLRDKPVAQSADGNDMFWILAVGFYLAPQAVNINHDGIIINGDGVSPDVFVDHILCKYLLRMLHK